MNKLMITLLVILAVWLPAMASQGLYTEVKLGLSVLAFTVVLWNIVDIIVTNRNNK